jgi:hypothetical protein
MSQVRFELSNSYKEPIQIILVWRSGAMNAEWMLDARKIPDKVMNYLRRIAVQAVEEKH